MERQEKEKEGKLYKLRLKNFTNMMDMSDK